MDAETVKAIKDAVEPLAQKIGQGAEFLYTVYYKQTIAEGFQDVILGTLGLLLSIASVVATVKLLKWGLKTWDKYDRGPATVCTLLVEAMVIATLGGWSVSGVIGGAKKFVNPHFYTIQRIIDNVKAKEVE